MKTQTKELLDKLDRTEFFVAVGQPVPDVIQSSVVTVSSWKEALRCSASIEWDNYTLEQRNLLTMYLGSHAHERDQDWNDIVEDVKQVAEPLAQNKVFFLSCLKQADREKVFNCVIWAIMSACMELEYADIRKPAFFCWLMEVYLLGRYPCGWGERKRFGGIRLYGPVDESDYDPNEPDPKKLVLAEQERIISPRIRMPAVGKLVIY